MKDTYIQLINNINQYLLPEKNITIIGHYAPDGDAIGACLALHNLFKKLGLNSSVVMPSGIPEFLEYLPGAGEIIEHNNIKQDAEDLLNNADIIFCVDFNSVSRVEKLSDVLKKSSAVKVMLDHHPEPENFPDFIISDTSVSSASEIVYEFIINWNKSYIDKEIADCIYTGIMTDTLNFSVNSSQRRTFEIIADLLSYGIDKDEIYSQVYNNYSYDRMRLAGYVLNQKMKIIPEYKSSYIILTKDDLKQYNFKQGDQEGFVNLPLSVKGVKIACFFMEKSDCVKVSLRSLEDYDVNKFARKYFNGGGHRNAAGGKLFIDINEVEEYVNRVIKLL